MLEIPYQQLSAEALTGLVEAFINREGTDYGAIEIDLTQKIEQVMVLIRKGEALVLFDEASESCNIVLRQDYQQWQQSGAS